MMGQSELTACDRSDLFHQKRRNSRKLTIPPENGKNGNYSGIEAVFWEFTPENCLEKWMRPETRV